MEINEIEKLIADLDEASSVDARDVLKRALEAARELLLWEECYKALLNRGIIQQLNGVGWDGDHVSAVAFSAGNAHGEIHKLRTRIHKYRERLEVNGHHTWDEATQEFTLIENDFDTDEEIDGIEAREQTIEELEGTRLAQAHIIRIERWLQERFAQSVGKNFSDFRMAHMSDAVKATATGTTEQSNQETSGQSRPSA